MIKTHGNGVMTSIIYTITCNGMHKCETIVSIISYILKNNDIFKVLAPSGLYATVQIRRGALLPHENKSENCVAMVEYYN